MFAPFGVRFLTQKSIPGCAISKHSGSRSLGAGAHSDKGGFATGFQLPRSAERPRRGRQKPLTNIYRALPASLLKPGHRSAERPQRGKEPLAPAPLRAYCIRGRLPHRLSTRFPVRAVLSFGRRVSGRNPRSARPKETATEPARTRWPCGSVTSLFDYEKSTWNSGLVNYHPCGAAGI